MIVFITIILIFTLYYISYYMYINRKYFKINKMLSNRKILPIESRPELLDKPLSSFYISTSHNSYLNFLQHFSFVKKSNIENVLNLGARVIELDISHINNIPIVAHGNKEIITTTYIYLEHALDSVLSHGFNTSDPLIIFCDIYNKENKVFLNNIINIFINKLKDKLLLPAQEYMNDYQLTDLPIKQFLNKVILCSSLDSFGILQQIFLSYNNFTNYEDTNKDLLQPNTSNKLSRVYKKPSIFSYFSFNIDFKPLWKNKFKLIALNFQMKDQLLYNYLEYFKNTSFIHESELKI